MLPRLCLLLRLLAPTLSVLICWVWWENAWAAIVGYHVQVGFWAWVDRGARTTLGAVIRGQRLCTLVAGAVLLCMGVMGMSYLLLPSIIKQPLADWLSTYELADSFPLMVVYLGLVHPWIEQAHWQPLWERTPLAYLCFAGYHGMVLSALLPWYWVGVAVLTLTLVSVLWRKLRCRQGTALPATLTHIAADLGMTLAVLVLVSV